MLSCVSHFNSGTRISQECVEAEVKENQTKSKALTSRKLHVSELLPLAAIPRVRGHPSTNVTRPGSQTDRAFLFPNAFILETLQDPCLYH